MDRFPYSCKSPQGEMSPLIAPTYQELISIIKIVADIRCRERGYQTMTFNKSDLWLFVQILKISHGPIHLSKEEQKNLTGRDFEKDCKATTERNIQEEFVDSLSGKLQVGINIDPKGFNLGVVANATNSSTGKRNESVKSTITHRETEGANTCLKTDVIVESVLVPCTLKIHKDVKIAVIMGNAKTVGTVVG